MYQELIDELQPKPIFNLKWYGNEDLYSDGDIEDTIIQMIAQNAPEDYTQAIADNYCWPTFYHLTRIRQNILNWYPFKKEGHVLEIGCGFGAITGLLCDRCEKVTAVELSKRRATGALLRCRERENLEIIVGNLNDIEFEEKFDYITLIGVLEYQGSYTNTDNPYLDFLKKIKSLLKPDGKLLIAIENQYGLKYWCGIPEDHTGIPFDGMNQYEMSNGKIRTFSKQKIDVLIKKSGFSNTFFYYPLPDYKLPQNIYSEKYLPQSINTTNLITYYITGTGTMVANEEKLYSDIINNEVFEFFANSFLVECCNTEVEKHVTFSRISYNRYPEYTIGTTFWEKEKVIKFPLYGGTQHIRQVAKNEVDLAASGLKVLMSSFDEKGNLVSEFQTKELLEGVLLEAYQNGNKQRIYEIWDKIWNDISISSDEVPWNENIMYTMNLGIPEDENKYGKILRTGFLDMTVSNAFCDNEDLLWFDQEWVLENVPAKFVLFRTIKMFYSVYYGICERNVPLNEIADRYELRDGWNDYGKLEELFQGVVVDNLHFSEFLSLRGNSLEDRTSSIKRLMNI